jgi:Skp family chaperone for outer membrane proteins
MKNLITNTLLVLLSAFPAIAQDASQEKADKIKPLFTAFLTEKLDMTVDESLIFWAAHNELEKARETIRNEKKELRKKPNEKESLSDKELEENVIQMGDLLIQEIELNRAFILECFNILDPNRAAKIPFFERQFRERIKERRSQGSNR